MGNPNLVGTGKSTGSLPKVIELDREGLYFVSRDGDYWVYVDAVDRLVKVFSNMEDAIAYGLHTTPESVNIEIIDKGIEVVGGRGWEIREHNYVVRVCVDNECEEYRAWGEAE
jgi:hypothetical protein